MKEENYLKKILNYPTTSTDLLVDFSYPSWKSTVDYVDDTTQHSTGDVSSCPLFRRLLYVKWYNSTLHSEEDGGRDAQDDTGIYRRRFLKGEYVPFDSKYTGVLCVGRNSTRVESQEKILTVGVMTRKTIIFESCDSRVVVDLTDPSEKKYKDLPVRFLREKSHKELFKEYCVEKSPLSLREVYPSIEVFSTGGNLKDLCLEFISIKSRLFFGSKTVDCYSLGDSLLFFSLVFKDSCVVPHCLKIQEYIQSVLSENMIGPNIVPSYIFLYETLVFITKIYQSQDQLLSTISTIDTISPMENNPPVNLKTIHENIFSLEDEEDASSSLAFRRIFSIHKNILSYYKSNLHRYIKKEEVSRVVNRILSRKKFHRYEILGILVHTTSIENFFQAQRPVVKDEESMFRVRNTLEDLKEEIETLEVNSSKSEFNKNILDYDCLQMVQSTLDVLHKHLKGPSSTTDIFKDILDIYYSLRYIGSKFITDIFSYGVLVRVNRFNISNIKRLLKYRGFREDVVDRLKEYRRMYYIQRDLCERMEVDLDPTYNTIEKKVLLNLSGVRSIRKGEHIQGMIEKGRCLEEEMYQRYKIYLYEYLREKKKVQDYERYFR